MTLELGIDTFGDVTNDAAGNPIPYAQVLRNLVAQGVLADQVGLDYIGVGEHHREDFAVSAPEVVLAAIAAQTERIHVGTAVTVLSSDDPIRVFQRFATLDGISSGRAEVILGRGSFTESFPLFGLDLAQYEQLFEEKLELFAAVRQQTPVTWSGSVRGPVVDKSVYPPVEHGLLPAWIGVGGSPESVVRTAKYGFNLMLAIIGGEPERFAPYVDLFHRAIAQFGMPLPKIGVHSPGHIAATDEQAREELWPHHSALMNRLGKERGWGPMSRESFEHEIESGSLYVGSPETVAQKIAKTATTLGLDRFDLKYSNGTLAHEKLMTSIELYGTQVAPRVRELLAD
ncbi:LLM class flavin-dependent oxidoreductase [Lacisediminihabitans changchengi]|uniref:LLM class flavin-dependent oxidoreductase n=1 Tax=Lacisediminihabitans changchengi TaxID=2787634 RepID=A0A934SU51_9MICO|nr:LLM class flavin-dependent oxidoreductase [Lacisediminihabitans changchengi]MBK4349013.1 LLM class flavin-dependent oxidoreductase [Lacisediminihabitans changchengi]